MKRSKQKAAATGTAKSKLKTQQRWPFNAESGPVGLALLHIDVLVERIQQTKVKSFDEALLAQLRKLEAAEIKAVSDHLKNTISTMQEALDGDEYCLESYSHFTKPQLRLAVQYFKAVAKLKPDGTGKIRLRKATVRKTKQKSPDVVVKKVLFLPKDKETGVTSIPPTELVGAKELWVYNTKTRKLGCYYAKATNGLSAKGTTILNYDEKRSTTKTIRKPDKQIREFMSGRVEWCRSYWNAIKAVPQEISPRLSRDTLLLKCVSN